MKKLIIPALILSTLLGCQINPSKVESEIEQERIDVPLGGNAYIIRGENHAKISTEGLQDWESDEVTVKTYVHFSEPSTSKVLLNFAAIPTVSSRLIITVDHQQKEIDITPSGTSELDLGEFDFQKGYAAIQIEGNSGEQFPSIGSITLIPKGNSSNISFVKDNEENRFYWGRRGPSVHMTYDLPENSEVEWFYNEMLIPEQQDPIGSYFMANGFAEGYFGIQVNSENERRVLFSVWSPFQTDNPDEIPEDQKIKLLKKGSGVNTGEFGNEGSGGQSYFQYDWKAGTTYKFLNSARPDGNGNTIYTAYFYAPETGSWKLIASFLRPQTDTWYKRPHSFLENFIDRNGYLERKVFFKNQWAKTTEGDWINLNTAKFTGDDIARRNYRLDYEGGVEDEGFFLRNGGFFSPNTPLDTKFSSESSGNQPEIDFSSLP